ncbi:MAG: transporter substrate-binding protein [Clostridia bacterium]|jgi:multiple sugar transport system substrate-binding protein|uniref:extracellular solute-binding protein n=1 Tax=Petroclostridium xylanilyticum TaxID=1792311 RepID=UPI000B99ACD3|nr:extracellular solute-binding protein [Petroclostridium xylanilyticum]MBZ4647360.1 transporter substrate-binding protein [Clostridia bacterium]
MKKRLFRKIIGIALIFVMMVSMAVGCSNQVPSESKDKNLKSTESTSQEKEKEKVTISFWHHYNAQSPENKTLNEVIIPAFEEKFPHIKVKAVSHEWAQLHKKILVSASANQLPDVARSDIAWVPEFQKLNILVALDKEMKDFQNVANNILEGPMNTAKVKGNYYGLGLNTNTKILFYNKEMFDKAQVAVPKTMDEFFEAARKLTKEENGQKIWGYAEPALSGWNICPFIWSNGGDITDPEYKVATGYLNSPETIEIIQKLADLYKDGAMIGFNKGDIPLTDGYGRGRYAMIIEGPWKFAELAGSYPDFKPETAQMPAGKGGSAQVLGGEDIIMFSTANKEAAWEFMKFMTGEFAQIEMAKVGQIPVNKTAIESDAVKGIKNFAPFLKAIKTAKPRPPVSTWPEIDKELTTAVTLAITGEKPVKAALDDAAKKIDELLKKQ